MNRRCSILVAGLVGVVLVPFPTTTASAGCAGPSFEDAESLVLHRDSVTSVEGRGFFDGCRDTQSCSGIGCQSCEYTEPPEEPRQDVRLELRQQGRTWPLATADAGTAEDQQLGWITWTFDLPAGVEPGPARLVADGAQPVEVRVR